MKYKIEQVIPKNGLSWVHRAICGQECEIWKSEVGLPGLLYVDVLYDVEPHRIITSVVQDVKYDGDKVVLVTENTKYILVPSNEVL